MDLASGMGSHRNVTNTQYVDINFVKYLFFIFFDKIVLSCLSAKHFVGDVSSITSLPLRLPTFLNGHCYLSSLCFPC